MMVGEGEGECAAAFYRNEQIVFICTGTHVLHLTLAGKAAFERPPSPPPPFPPKHPPFPNARTSAAINIKFPRLLFVCMKFKALSNAKKRNPPVKMLMRPGGRRVVVWISHLLVCGLGGGGGGGGFNMRRPFSSFRRHFHIPQT